MMSAEQADYSEVSAFAAILRSRVAADARVARAMGLAWVGAGAAIASGLAGLGILIALYGYSYTISVKPAAEQTARAFVLALERTQLKTTVSGTMSLAPNSEVKLAAGQTVRLQPGATVRLDPNSSVRAVVIDTPQPSNQQLGLSVKANTNELPFTSY